MGTPKLSMVTVAVGARRGSVLDFASGWPTVTVTKAVEHAARAGALGLSTVRKVAIEAMM